MAKAQQFVNQSISHLRFVDEVWDAACVRIADLPLPRPLSGWGVIVSDASSGQILAVEHMESADDDAVVNEIIAAFLHPENGEPRQPLTLRVPDGSLAELLRSRLADSPTTIEVAAVPVAIERLTTFLTMVSEAVDEVPQRPTAAAPEYFRAAPLDPVAVALAAVIARAAALPGAKPRLRRLAWSFYWAPEPAHAADGEAMESAIMRFLDWCVFASDRFALPLGEQIRAAARDIALEAADIAALLTPRFSFFDVVESNVDHVRVRDRRSDELLRVRRVSSDRSLAVGELIAGGLHPTGRGDHVIGFGALTLSREAAAQAPTLTEERARNVGLFMEVFFDASADWIDDLTAKQVRETYESLRKAVRATGDRLPALAQLQRAIAAAESATDLFQELVAAAQPWGVGEAEVLNSLFMRIWNFTPRPELGGKSPEQMSPGK